MCIGYDWKLTEIKVKRQQETGREVRIKGT